MTNNTNCCEIEVQFYYAVTYSIILVPGLIGNVLALWVFYAYIKETKKAVIFMINLAIADLAQVLSLPLRIFYYLHKHWPFGDFLCMACFYLKYVNMYASIYFLVCISVRRCMILIYPLRYNNCKRKCDVFISVAGWLVVGICCLPFPIMRQYKDENYTICFSDLPLRNVGATASVLMLVIGELVGFVLPLVIVVLCSWKTAMSLRDTNPVLNDSGEKKKALKMILTCAVVFLICFAPYHFSFPFHFLEMGKKVNSDCRSRKVITVIHLVSLCLASLNSCLDPIIYYFTTDEFKRRLSRQDLQDSIQLHKSKYSKSQSRTISQG
ncbi:probable G-protein coupled receptor 174 [Latimeria chalumnae]|uniref:probable G-protein coupled receptor 174 n=1 Tax=Latimeria chalumnae TaxID=7897 RepID=UPI0003C15867|nr:PREDICTED: probable G-protein coupled receptor 174 [Latimeria chalumnae]|eukprot:XP_006002269.1 PREDICTED: probable G-protein coupled receptor 174 [Latimeria chalumnae]